MSYDISINQNVFNYHDQKDYYNTEPDMCMIPQKSNHWSNGSRSNSPFGDGSHSIYQHYGTKNTTNNSQLFEENYTQNYQYRALPFGRVIKRRTTANKKERRRTQSINNAYADLRDCIPNVPPDTKLSKIKTLRLATSYIIYLEKALETDCPTGCFTAELDPISEKSSSNSSTILMSDNCCYSPNGITQTISENESLSENGFKSKKIKGRTGWPQHVWAYELEQEQQL